jgi:hypothetical protein
VGLFFSAYLPLFLILAIKNWFNIYAFGIFVFTLIYSGVWFVLIWLANRATAELFTVRKAESRINESLEYLVPYIISFIGFDLTKWQDVISLGILLVIVFAVYIRSDLLYINPLMACFGHSIYQVEVTKPSQTGEGKRGEIILITKSQIKSEDTIQVWDLSDNVFWGKVK